MKEVLREWLSTHQSAFHKENNTPGWWYIANFLGSKGYMHWDDLRELQDEFDK